MSDLINRQAAIKLAIDLDYESRGILKESRCREIENRYNMIPSAQPDIYDRNVGEWDMFDLITSAYYGKGMYFKQDNGTVYSRYSCEYMSVDEAIREFLALMEKEI